MAPSASEQIVIPSGEPATINGIWAIARNARRAGREVAASGSMTVRRAAISENSAPTKNALPSRSNTVISRLTISRFQPGDAYLLDPTLVDLDDGELPAVLGDGLADDRDVPQSGHQEAGECLIWPLRQPEPG